MTVAATARKAGPYNGNGIATAFAFAFKIFATSDVLVVRTTPGGVETTLLETTDYAVVMNSDQNNNPGGTINMVVAPPTNYLLTLGSRVPLSQGTALPNAGPFFAAVVETAFDRVTALVQQDSEKLGRAVVVPISSSIDPATLINTLTADAATASADAATASAAAATALAAAVALPNAVVAGSNKALVTDEAGLSWLYKTAAQMLAWLGAAASGANADITSLSGLTTPISVAQGGTGTSVGVSSKIQPISASVAANALTCTLNPTSLDFRSLTLTDGTVVTQTIASPLSLTVPNTATLGTVNAIAARLAVVALYNTGGANTKIGIINLSGGINLDETTMLASSALSASSTAANVCYSFGGSAAGPFRVVGFVDITEATAGTWATAPTLVQGYGGQALAAMSSIGYGQTWQNVAGSRAVGTTYYNTTGRPIAVSVTLTQSTVSYQTATVGGTVLKSSDIGGTSSQALTYMSFIVPPGNSYSVTRNTGAPTIDTWLELR